MVSDEEQITFRLEQIQCACNLTDYEEVGRFVSDDFMGVLPDYPPMIGKKIAFELFFGGGPARYDKEPIKEETFVRSTKIHVSKMGEIAHLWGIRDYYLDDDLILTDLMFSGWVKQENEWFMESISVQNVENGWTW